VPIREAMCHVTRHGIAAVLVAAALAATGAVFLFARPQFRPEHQGRTIRIPDHRPADGWRWPDGVPGWKPGQTIDGFNVSGVQPVEVHAAQLAAARNGLDASRLRVLTSLRPGRNGALAVVAAPTLYESPTRTCLAATLPGDRPVAWRCNLAGTRVLVVAAAYRWPKAMALYLAGVASGDVKRIELDGDTLYERGKTWGEFSAARTIGGTARLRIVGRDGRVRQLPLDLRAGEQRVSFR
jgi:hypothetical protein